MPWTAENNLKLLLTIMSASSSEVKPDWNTVAENFGAPHTIGSLKKQFSRIKQMTAENGNKEDSATPTSAKSLKRGKDRKEPAVDETPTKRTKKEPVIKAEHDEREELTIGLDD